jgi:hypothetical protein
MIEKDDWKPEGLPEMKHDFEGSVTQEKQAPAKTSQLSPAQKEYQRYFSNQKTKEEPERKPATKWELELLLEARDRPKPELNYDMTGPDQQAVENGIHQRRENLINDLVKRLAPLQNKARDDFNINADTFLHDKTKAEQGMERD